MANSQAADGANGCSGQSSLSNTDGGASSREIWALVDGVGVYSPSPGSPFLTSPSFSATAVPDAGAPSFPRLTVEVSNLRDLSEALRARLATLPLTRRFSEEDATGMIEAILDVIVRHGFHVSGPNEHALH